MRNPGTLAGTLFFLPSSFYGVPGERELRTVSPTCRLIAVCRGTIIRSET